MVLPLGLHNTVATISHLVAQRTIPSLMNNELVGMIKSITESLHGLLMEGPGSKSGSDSDRGSHHPSRECFMTETPKGHIESVSVEETTPAGNLSDGTKGGIAAPPHVGVEQLRAQKQEIDEAGQQLVREYMEVDEEIKRRGDGGHTRAMAHDIN